MNDLRVQAMVAILRATVDALPSESQPAVLLGYLNAAVRKYEKAHPDVHGADCFSHNVLVAISNMIEEILGEPDESLVVPF